MKKKAIIMVERGKKKKAHIVRRIKTLSRELERKGSETKWGRYAQKERGRESHRVGARK